MHRRTVKSVRHMGAPVAQLGRFIALNFLMGNAKSYFHLHFHCFLYNSIQETASWVCVFVIDLVGFFYFSKTLQMRRGAGMTAQRF